MNLAERCIAIRAKYNLTQTELGFEIGRMSTSQISRIENNTHRMHRAREKRISDALDRLEKKMEGKVND